MNRRNKRTSFIQYTYFLDIMEANPRLAANTLSRQYEAKKWKEMSIELNKCPMGPKLSAEDWRKRLHDWKNSTRSKYRRNIAAGHRGASMSALETRAMQIFFGEPITFELAQYDELPQDKVEQESQEEFIDEDPHAEYEELEPAEEYENPMLINRAEQSFSQIIRLQNEPVIYEVESILPTITPEEEEPVPSFGKEIHEQIKRLSDIHEAALHFKIARFKYKNPGFEYNSENI